MQIFIARLQGAAAGSARFERNRRERSVFKRGDIFVSAIRSAACELFRHVW